MVLKSKYEMYYGASQDTLKKANALRKNETNAERLLWKKLRSRQFENLKFRRQHPISQFIVDFYCHSLKLVIEVDGEIHNKPENREYDENLTAELERFELKVIRFTNHQIENDLNRVLNTISKVTQPPS